MRKFSTEITEENYRRIWLTAATTIFIIVTVLGIWGVFGDADKPVFPNKVRPSVTTGAAGNAANR